MPGADPAEPGKAPNPGGRPYGDSVKQNISFVLECRQQGALGATLEQVSSTYVHKDCMP